MRRDAQILLLAGSKLAPGALPEDGPMPTAVDNFVVCLRKSQILEQPHIDRVLEDFASSQFTEADALASLCRMFVSRGLLTTWQVEKLLQQKHMGFHLDDYLLLDYLGTSADYARYLTRHLPTGRCVTLRIHHPRSMRESWTGIRYEPESSP